MNDADQIFLFLLLMGLILASVGGLLFIVSEIFERKQEVKDFKQNQLSKSFNNNKVNEIIKTALLNNQYYKFDHRCYCRFCKLVKKTYLK
tara:strand:- start:8 stop:277 length:270 start_codon:yes stop_codon:yes gene_type:complete